MYTMAVNRAVAAAFPTFLVFLVCLDVVWMAKNFFKAQRALSEKRERVIVFFSANYA